MARVAVVDGAGIATSAWSHLCANRGDDVRTARANDLEADPDHAAREGLSRAVRVWVTVVALAAVGGSLLSARGAGKEDDQKAVDTGEPLQIKPSRATRFPFLVKQAPRRSSRSAAEGAMSTGDTV